MGADSEQQPLLASPAAAAATKTQRRWRFAWWQVAGDGSAHDVAACCLSWNAPAIAFGWNSGRGLGLKWWKEALKFFLLTTVLFYALYGAAVGVQFALCGEPPGGYDRDGPNQLLFPMRGAADDEGHHHHHHSSFGHDHHHDDEHHEDAKWAAVDFPASLPLPEGALPAQAADMPAQMAAWDSMCASRMLPWIPLVVLAGSSIIVASIMFAARRRTLLRERFGIEGTKAGDCCLWAWCSPCALAQETRTLMHNNVEEGLWLGPHSVHSAQHGQYVPVPQYAPTTEPPVVVVAAPPKA